MGMLKKQLSFMNVAQGVTAAVNDSRNEGSGS